MSLCECARNQLNINVKKCFGSWKILEREKKRHVLSVAGSYTLDKLKEKFFFFQNILQTFFLSFRSLHRSLSHSLSLCLPIVHVTNISQKIYLCANVPKIQIPLLFNVPTVSVFRRLVSCQAKDEFEQQKSLRMPLFSPPTNGRFCLEPSAKSIHRSTY